MHDKELPDLPPPDRSDDEGAFSAPTSTTIGSADRSLEENHHVQSRPDVATGRFGRLKSPLHGTNIFQATRRAHGHQTVPSYHSSGTGELGGADSASGDDAAAIGLGVGGTSTIFKDLRSSDHPADSPASPKWLNRVGEFRNAGQNAGAGLRKFGKASAAKMKQAQQMRGNTKDANPILGAWNRSTSNLRKYSGSRGAKSAADLSMTSPSFSDAPSMPSPTLPKTSPDPRIGLPTDVRHNVHVDVGPQGYTGLPVSWAQVLAQFGLDAEEVKRNPAGAAELVRERTQYYVGKEAERGEDPENTRKLLESKLYDLEDLRDAVRSGVSEHRKSTDNVTRSDATTVRRHSDASTAYGGILNTGGPPSPTWSDAPALPSPPQQYFSPSLPQVSPQEEDWGASLLQALPKSASNNSNRISKRATRTSASLNQKQDDAGLAPMVHGETGSVGGTGRVSASPDFYGSDAEELRENVSRVDDEEPSIMTASKVSAAKATKGPQLLSHPSESDIHSAWRRADRRESDSSIVGSTHSHSATTSSSHAPSAWTQPHLSATASRPESAQPDTLSTAHSVSSARESLSQTSNPGHGQSSWGKHSSQQQQQQHPHQQAASAFATTTPLHSRASADSSMASSDLNHHVSSGLRERRKAPPRIYPPSANRYIPRDDEPSPRSIGFKPVGTGARPSSSASDSLRRSPQPGGSDSHASGEFAQGRLSSANADRAQDLSGRLSNTSMRATSRQSQSAGQSAPTAAHPIFSGMLHNSTDSSSLSSPLTPAPLSASSRISAGHHVPEFIHPDADGFYKPLQQGGSQSKAALATSRDSARISNTTPPIVTLDASSPNSGAKMRQRPGSNTLRSPSPLSSHSAAGSNVSAVSTTAPAISSNGSQETNAVQEDYQPASDFINDWISAERDVSPATSPVQAEFGDRSLHTKMLARKADVARLFAAPGKHQSPSPALLQGLPSPYRPTFSQSDVTNVPASSVRTPAAKSKHPDEGHESEWLESPQQSKVPLKEDSSSRDWRVRSLPPPPPDNEAETHEQDDADSDGRASIISLPMQESASLASGPPTADADAMEAAALSRPSSRQSRSSSRSGRRSTARRSTDVRRFPVSMHYASGFDTEGLGLDPEASVSFADLMRARQSVNLDDVMPMNIGGADNIPPVPPLPRASLDRQQVLPQSALHLEGVVCLENPNEVFGELVMIGEGDSGDVFSSIPRLGSTVMSTKGRGKVAIKIVRMPQSSEEQASARLKNLDRELDLWRSVQPHGNIVSLYDTFVSDDVARLPGVWIVQEFLSMALADVIALRSMGLNMTERQMSRIILDVTQGLSHLHLLEVIHRDVRSDNVMLTLDGVAKLSDFTHAVRLTPQQRNRNSVVGTAYWMAPEVVKAEEYNVKADLWSLGVVIYEMLEGSPPRVDFPALRVRLGRSRRVV